MDLLLQYGLFGGGLVTIDSPEVIRRYNTALREMGLRTTNLTSFRIDGMGWSPEIAEELDDFYYLSHGGTVNPYGLIVTPKQEGKALYAMHHSFDIEMFQSIFDRNRKQIEDITREEAIWFPIDNGVQFYDTPSSLLLLNGISLKFKATNDLIAKAEYQKGLIMRFFHEELSWKDEILLDDLLESIKEHSDLRYRQIIMHPMHFNNFTSYHTRSFGGVFVIRETSLYPKPILICEDKKWQTIRSEMKDDDAPFELFTLDNKVKKFLVEKQFLHISPEYWRRNIDRLELIKEYFFMKSLVIQGVSKEFAKTILEDPQQCISRIVSMRENGSLHKKYDEIEKFIQHLKNPDLQISYDESVLENHLLVPNKELLSKQTQEMLWRLLARIRSSDIIINYTMEKELFFKKYLEWSEAMKYWVSTTLAKNYFSSNYRNPNRINKINNL